MPQAELGWDLLKNVAVHKEQRNRQSHRFGFICKITLTWSFNFSVIQKAPASSISPLLHQYFNNKICQKCQYPSQQFLALVMCRGECLIISICTQCLLCHFVFSHLLDMGSLPNGNLVCLLVYHSITSRLYILSFHNMFSILCTHLQFPACLQVLVPYYL